MGVPAEKARKDLSADSLHKLLHDCFDRIPDHRLGQPKISLGDALMSGFAMFSLKDPSLLAFDDRRHDPNDNFRTIYGINSVPSDTQMRTILDPVDPDSLRSGFTDVFRRLQRGKVLEDYAYLNGAYLVSLDGTTYYNSDKIHCPSCLAKRHRNGVVSYYHQLLAAALVHPDLKEVIPLAPEPIIKQDGSEKNDCERNATRRWLKRFRQEHPHLPVIVVEDALGSNAPHLRDLAEARARYIIGVKPGDHAFLFQQLRGADDDGQTRCFTQVDAETNILRHFRWHLQVPLNESNADLLGERSRILGNPARRRHPAFQLDHRLVSDGADRLRHHAWRPSPLEDRERDFQHAEKPGLQSGAQLRPRRTEPVRGAGRADDAGVLGGPSPAAVLSAYFRPLARSFGPSATFGNEFEACSKSTSLSP